MEGQSPGHKEWRMVASKVLGRVHREEKWSCVTYPSLHPLGLSHLPDAGAAGPLPSAPCAALC